MTKIRDEVLKMAISTYGQRAQQDMMIEEMSELTKALCKLRRAGDGDDRETATASVLEEIADVQIMLDQMKLLYGTPDDIDREKVDRLADRLARHIEAQRSRKGERHEN